MNPAETPDKVSSDFNVAIDEVTQYLLSNIKLKPGLSANFDGSMLANLAEKYQEALNLSGNIIIERSLYATIIQKLENLMEELIQKYRKKMVEILEPRYPLEEGTMNDVEHPPTTLMAFHQQVFEECRLTLGKQVDLYMPTLNTASFKADNSTICKKKIDILAKFQRFIYEYEASPGLAGQEMRGALHQFVSKNKQKSFEQCTDLFDCLVEQQGDVRLSQLEQQYMAKAIGPAKAEVFEKKAQWISGQPEDVEVSGMSHNQVKITWKKPTIHRHAACIYEVQKKEEGSEWISLEATQNLYKVVTDLRPNVEYNFRVRGVNTHMHGNKGEWSKELTVTTLPDKPNKPQRPKITIKSSTRVTLIIQQLQPNEDNGSAVTHVIVETKLQDSPSKVTQFPMEPQDRFTTVMKDIPLDSATFDGFYYFRVSMKNSVGESEPSEWAEVPTIELIPGPPQNPFYTKSDTNQIVLQWSQPSVHPVAVKKYEVQRGYATGIWNKVAETQPNVMTATIFDLKPSTKYRFRIWAVNEKTKGNFSKEFEAQTKPGVPNKPSKPDLTIIAPHKATVTVQQLRKENENGSPVTHVIIEKCTVASAVNDQWSSEEFAVDADVELIKKVITLENSVQYFRVRMKNEVGISEPSAIVQASYLIPGPPQNIREQVNLWVKETSYNRITVSWDKPDAQPQAVKQYEVEVKQEGDQDPHYETADSLENLTATFSKLKPNTVYRFRVRGTSEKKCGEWSEPLQVKSAPGPPNQPSKPAIQMLSAGKVFISIDTLKEEEQNGSLITHIIIEECSAECTDWKPSHKLPIDAGLPVIEKCIPLANAISYFRVQMVNEIGRSKPSEMVLVPEKDLIPGPPENVKFSAVTSNTLQLSWEKPITCPRAANQYEVEMKTKEDSGWIHKTIVPCDEMFALFKTLHPDTEYWFRVCAKNGNREGEYSKEVFQKTDPGPPNRPSKPDIQVISDCKATISVPKFHEKDENGNPVNFLVVQVCTEENPDAQWSDYEIFHMKCNKTFKKEIGIKDDSFYFRVLVENEVGRSEPSDHIEVPASNLVPGKPKNLKLAEASYNWIDLKWDKPQRFSRAAKRYELEIKEEGGEWRQVAISENLERKVHISNLNPHHKYHFRIVAVNQNQRGEYSDELVAQTCPGPPSHPQKPELHIKSATTAVLTVQRLMIEEENGSSVTHMIVENSKDGGDWNVVGNETHLVGEDIIRKVVPLSSGISYFRVKMKNEVGISDPSPVVYVPPAVFPGKPKHVHADVSHNKVTITWQQPDINPRAATQYELENNVRDNEWKVLKIVRGTPFQAIAENLHPSTNYKFRICAVNGPHDKRGEHKEISAKTIEIPGKPNELKVIERRLNCFKMSWCEPSKNSEYVQYYVVHIRKSRARTWQHLNLISKDFLSVVITGLDEATYYDVFVRAVNQKGNGGYEYTKVGTKYPITAAFGRFFLGHQDTLNPDNPDLPPQNLKERSELPEEFKLLYTSERELNEMMQKIIRDRSE